MKSFIAALRSLVLPFGRTSGTRIILDGVNGAIQLYDASDDLAAELTLDGPGGEPAIVSYGSIGADDYYNMLNGADLRFGMVGDDPGEEAFVAFEDFGDNLRTLFLESGSSGGLSASGIFMFSEWNSGGSEIDIAADLVSITGALESGNEAFGTVTITPVASVPTSVTVSGLSVVGTAFRGFATANTTVIGSVVMGVAVSSVTSTGLLVWVYRTNNTNTVVNWMVKGVP